MPYVPLNKLFYSDSKNYDKIYAENFGSKYAVHVDFKIGEFDAFFVQTPEIIAKMLAIYKAANIVNLFCCDLPGVALEQFTTSCLIDEIVLTNNIEGVHSTRREIYSLLEGGGKSTRFYGLVQKYLMLRKGKTLEFKTCADIRAVYDELVLREVETDDPDNVPDGEIFRKGSVSVSSQTQKELHRGLYPESSIITAMERALAFLNDESVELLYRAAAFHYFIGYIHPFYDGNGRLNRFISSYLLGSELCPLVGFRLSYTVKQNISDYYKAFGICNDPKSRGDITPFVEMFLGIVETAVTQLGEALQKRSEKLAYYRSRSELLPDAADAKMAQLYDYLIQAALFSENGIGTEELLRLFGVSRNTLQKKLGKVEAVELLQTVTKNRMKFYKLDLNAFDELLERSK